MKNRNCLSTLAEFHKTSYKERGTENSTQENSTQKTQHIVKNRKLNTGKLNTENSTQKLNTFN